jgi:hypothetical protein
MTHVSGYKRTSKKGKRHTVKSYERKGKLGRKKVPKRDVFEESQVFVDQIDRNYRTHIETNWDEIESQLKELPEYGEDEERPSAYFTVDKTDKYVELYDISFPDMISPWPDPDKYWTVPIMVDSKTTKKELLDQSLGHYSDFD